MVAKTWDGSTASYFNPNHWTPSGVPQPGDIAVIGSGDVSLQLASVNGVIFDLGSPDATATLTLRNASLGAGTSLNIFDPNYNGAINPFPQPSRTANLEVSGFATDAGGIDVGGFLSPNGNANPGHLTVGLAPLSIFDLTGSIVVQPGSSLDVGGRFPSALVNDGQIESFSTADIGVPVLGDGTIRIDFGKVSAGTVEFASFVGPGQAIAVDGLGFLTIDQPRLFFGSITEAPTGGVTLKNIQTTSSAYNDGVLSIYNGQNEVAQLRIASLTDAGFNVANVGSNVVVTTPGPIGAAMPNTTTGAESLPQLASLTTTS